MRSEGLTELPTSLRIPLTWATEEDQREDRDDRDEGQDQRVFRETLSILAADRIDECL